MELLYGRHVSCSLHLNSANARVGTSHIWGCHPLNPSKSPYLLKVRHLRVKFYIETKNKYKISKEESPMVY